MSLEESPDRNLVRYFTYIFLIIPYNTLSRLGSLFLSLMKNLMLSSSPMKNLPIAVYLIVPELKLHEMSIFFLL